MDKKRTAKVADPAKASDGVDSAGGPLSGQGADGGLTDISGLDFEQAMAELESLVGRMEQGEVPLEESLKAFERGRALVDRCKSILDDAERRIEQMGLDSLPGGERA